MLLQVENLHKTFDRGFVKTPVLGGVNLEIHSGEVTLITGRSGAGKSVLLSILAGIDRPTSGRVRLLGQDIHALNDTRLSRIRARDIRLVFQNHNLIDEWTVQDNLLAADLTCTPRYLKINRAVCLLRRFDTARYLDRVPGELSMGQQMRVVIARAMMVKPKVLLADEPTAELDAESAEVVLRYLTRLAREEEIAVVVASLGHFPSRFADRHLALAEGRVHPIENADVLEMDRWKRCAVQTGSE